LGGSKVGDIMTKISLSAIYDTVSTKGRLPSNPSTYKDHLSELADLLNTVNYNSSRY